MVSATSLEFKETTTLIGSDKVEGTAVYGADQKKIGSIQRVMIDKIGGKVAYAVLSFGGFMGIGDDYYPVPWATLKYDTNLGGYRVELYQRPTRQSAKIQQHHRLEVGSRKRPASVRLLQDLALLDAVEPFQGAGRAVRPRALLPASSSRAVGLIDLVKQTELAQIRRASRGHTGRAAGLHRLSQSHPKREFSRGCAGLIASIDFGEKGELSAIERGHKPMAGKIREFVLV